MARLILLASLTVVMASGQTTASNTTASPIATDRPAVTDSSVVVPAGSLQVESGFAQTSSKGQDTLDAPEMLLRFGVVSNTELRLTVPDYFGQIGMSSGFGDLMVGMKQQLGPTRDGFDVSLVVSLSVPTGARGISSHGYDPSVQLSWSRALSSNWTGRGNAIGVLADPGRPAERNRRDHLPDRRAVDQDLGCICRIRGRLCGARGTRHLVHFGTAYKPTPRQQLDLHVGVGLSAAAVDRFVGVGYSFRVQAARR
jgi:outer membrane putative beta-barrel porin/alpha-amylase